MSSGLLHTASGEVFRLGTEIGRGGEGTIFASPRNHLECAKIYAKPLPAASVRKLELMVRNRPNDPAYASQKHHSIAWPSGLLYSDSASRGCVGFVMPKIDITRFHKALQLLDPADRALGFTWKHLFVVCRNIASSIAAVHEKGYCIGDINESNILVAPTALITLIDCDSFQVPDPDSGRPHRCLVGKPEYTAPELQGKAYADVDRTPESDCFAMAVLMFQLLMEGTHPYQAKGKLVDDAPTSEMKIVRGYFPYSMPSKDIAPPDHAPPFDILPPAIRGLFQKCFAQGNRSPASRPKASEWLQVLESCWVSFNECALNSNHSFPAHLNSCPWCERAALTGRDPFPSPVGLQIALADPTEPLNSLDKRVEAFRSVYVSVALADGVITPAEEKFLLAKGRELQIPPKTIKTVIRAEVNKVIPLLSRAAAAGASFSPPPSVSSARQSNGKVALAWAVIGLWAVLAMIAAFSLGRPSAALNPAGVPAVRSQTRPAGVASIPTGPLGPSSANQQASPPGTLNNQSLRTSSNPATPTPPARISLEAKLQNAALQDASALEVFVDGLKADASRSSASSLALFTIPNLLAGRRTVEIKHPDYETWKGSVALSEAPPRPLEVLLVPKPATLSVEVVPQVNYVLNVDGARAAGFGGRFKVAAERDLALEVIAKDFQLASRTVRLPANGRDEWRVMLEPVRLSLEGRIQNAALKHLASANVTVDGAKVDALFDSSDGTALFTITNMPAGKRTLEIAHPDYEVWKGVVSVSEEKPRQLDVRLVPKPGTLEVDVSPKVDYALYCNGRPVSRKLGDFTLPAENDLTLQVRAKDYEIAECSLLLPANGHEVWRVALAPGPRLILNAAAKDIKPSGYVTLNGRNYLSFGFLGFGKKVAEGETISIGFQGVTNDIEVASIHYGKSYQLRYKGQSLTVPMRMDADPPPNTRPQNKTFKVEKTFKK